MNHRERIETAWSLREPDRVPIELTLTPLMRQDPRSERLQALIAEHADNFLDVPGPSFGFMGFPTSYHEEVIEDRPGEYRRIRRTHVTEAGTFTAVTYHPDGNEDYHWEKRFLTEIDELRRIAERPRPPARIDRAVWEQAMAGLGDGVPISYLYHPLGALVRNATMEEVYTWLYEAGDLVHRFLAASADQVCDAVTRMLADGMGPYFMTFAHEMLLPPWMGRDLFEEFVFPYDAELGDAIHRHGGKWRAHSHGNCLDFLTRLSQMGIDAIEPLEAPPAGDVDLAEAKRLVGDRMLLSGNIPSERFISMAPAEVRQLVRDAIHTGAPGGGFTLATSNGHGLQCTDEEMGRTIANCEAYLLAGLEYGVYPIG